MKRREDTVGHSGPSTTSGATVLLQQATEHATLLEKQCLTVCNTSPIQTADACLCPGAAGFPECTMHYLELNMSWVLHISLNVHVAIAKCCLCLLLRLLQ
eukprot:GHUV01041570.1.p3 GENE.GHUV01041570.1~~GHUV01041570.1.p3  ORF type:complete len:100 (+),score=10.08 GHUV01041570.1:217-516(+)